MGFDQARQRRRMTTHQKYYLRAATRQFVRKAQTPREMSHAHLDGSIDPNCDPLDRIHQTCLGISRFVVFPGRRRRAPMIVSFAGTRHWLRILDQNLDFGRIRA
jgi:hypothetical protein